MIPCSMIMHINQLETRPRVYLDWGVWEMCVIAKLNRLQRVNNQYTQVLLMTWCANYSFVIVMADV